MNLQILETKESILCGEKYFKFAKEMGLEFLVHSIKCQDFEDSEFFLDKENTTGNTL